MHVWDHNHFITLGCLRNSPSKRLLTLFKCTRSPKMDPWGSWTWGFRFQVAIYVGATSLVLKKPLLPFASEYSKLVKHGVVCACLSNALTKSCHHWIQKRFRGQIACMRAAGYPSHLLVFVSGKLRKDSKVSATCTVSIILLSLRTWAVPFFTEAYIALKIVMLIFWKFFTSGTYLSLDNSYQISCCRRALPHTTKILLQYIPYYVIWILAKSYDSRYWGCW